MKKILFILFTFILSLQASYAAGTGYVDYTVIYKQLPVSVQYQKKIDAKVEQIRAYNKVTKQQMEKQATVELKAKIKSQRQPNLAVLEKEYIDLRYKHEALVKSKVKTAAGVVLKQKGLDIIIDKRYQVAGGIDCTADILKAIK